MFTGKRASTSTKKNIKLNNNKSQQSNDRIIHWRAIGRPSLKGSTLPVPPRIRISPAVPITLGHRTPHAYQSLPFKREQTGCDEKRLSFHSSLTQMPALRRCGFALSVEDALVKVQLVSGNAEFNLLTNDDLYIDERLGLQSVGRTTIRTVSSHLPIWWTTTVRWTTLKLYGCRCSIRKPNGRIFRTMQSMSSARTILPLCPYYGPSMCTTIPFDSIKRIVEHFGYTFRYLLLW